MDGEGYAGRDFSILRPDGAKASGQGRRSAWGLPAFYQDLNLEQILDLLTLEGGKDIRKYYYDLPETEAEEAFRRAVYGDVKREGVRDALQAFVKRMAEAEDLAREKEKVTDGRQRAVWQLREAEARFGACAALSESLAREELRSEGLCGFRELLRSLLAEKGFRQLREQTEGLMGELRALRLVLTWEKDRISVALAENEPGEGHAGAGSVANAVGSAPAEQPLRNPFAASPGVTELEAACLSILEKKKPALFRQLPEAAARCGGWEQPMLSRFAQEIRYYLSYRSLQRDLEERGFAFATPTAAGDGLPAAAGLYDLALACASVKTGRRVVANDFAYREGERFFVLTGPNQGGKTTFARSLGQLIYFTRMGLDVPAREARVPFFPSLQTHFSVEESVETGRGKLKEELVRLSPMMEAKQRGTFVVINELFTTAASYDAGIMGRRVLAHFIALGCMGIYVTHLKELSEGVAGTAGLQAMLDERRVPTFEIRRGDATDLACAENQVNKYRLTYAQLKERLAARAGDAAES